MSDKKNKGINWFLVWFFVLVAFFGYYQLVISPNLEDQKSITESINPKMLKSTDVNISSEQGTFDLKVIITPSVEVSWVEIKLELLDSSGAVIKTETKRFNNLSRSTTYKFSYSMSLSELFSGKKYRFVFVDGRKA